MVTGVYVPHRGDIIWIDFDPRAGHEQAGRRPAIVLSDREYNRRTSLLIICPITSQHKPYPFIVVLPPTLLPKQSYVLADQAKSLDWRQRNTSFIAKVSPGVIDEVTQFAVGIIQGLR